jgi:PAS domain S-box-containing protein
LSDLLNLSEERRFQLLVSAVTDYAIYMLDERGRIATWNPGAQRFKGYTAEEIIGQHFSRFFTPEDIAADLPGRALAIAAREGRFEAEGWRMRKDGARFWAHVVIDPIKDDDGKLIGFAKVTRDISERKKAQDELESTREALFQSQKLQALGELTGGIAHDFNNLMTVIAGASDFLLKHPDLPLEKQRRYLKAIADTTDRATSLTNHLLAFGRRQAIKPVVLDLGVRLDAFCEMISRMLGSGIDVRLELNTKDARVEADAAQLESALLNAAVNSRDAMPSGGKLTVTLSDRELNSKPGLAISLTDTGEGISEIAKSRVFEPFFTTKEVGKGTGLGLSQIHGFAEQAGGRAEIDSVVGEGTTLTIILPRTDKPLAERRNKPEAIRIPPGLKVLLVEDNSHVRNFAAELLNDLKCNVVAAENGSKALELATSQEFDLVFSDVVMPAMTGVELAEQIAVTRPALPVLLATGYSEHLADIGSAEFTVVSKPYDATSLGSAISALISNRRPGESQVASD